MDKQFIAALVGSAGSEEALEKFFDRTPHDAVSFVIVRHLLREYRTMMQTILARHSVLRIADIVDGVPVERDTVYVAPAQYVTLPAGRFALKERMGWPNVAGDVFMRSLAVDAGPRAIGVVLSGASDDGSKGVRAIRDAGGLTLAQKPETCGFRSTPDSAIATGCIEAVAAVEAMPGTIHRYMAAVLAAARQGR